MTSYNQQSQLSTSATSVSRTANYQNIDDHKTTDTSPTSYHASWRCFRTRHQVSHFAWAFFSRSTSEMSPSTHVLRTCTPWVILRLLHRSSARHVLLWTALLAPCIYCLISSMGIWSMPRTTTSGISTASTHHLVVSTLRAWPCHAAYEYDELRA